MRIVRLKSDILSVYRFLVKDTISHLDSSTTLGAMGCAHRSYDYKSITDTKCRYNPPICGYNLAIARYNRRIATI